MNKKQLLEFIPLGIFLLSGICTVFKLPLSTWIVAFSGFFLGSLYFYFSFWLYAEFSISLMNRIIAGLFYSITIVACLFCFLNWPLGQLYSIISYVGLGLVIIICLFNQKIPSYKQLLYRCIFFIIVLSMLYGYRRFSA